MSDSEPAPASASLPAGPLDRVAAIRLVEQADALAAQGDYEQAGTRYARLVGHRDADIHVAALMGLAESRYRLDDEPAAEQLWQQATQAPDTSLSWLAWKQLAAGHVRGGDLRRARDAYREAERRAPQTERAEIASRLGWLNKEAGNQTAAQRAFGRARTDVAPSPILTYAILAVTVAIGISSLLGPSGEVLFALFALDKSAVAAGELYRLVSVVLVHSPTFILHLASNMYALYLVGPVVEGLYGRALFLGIYLLTAAAGSTASYVFVPNDSVGASGAIFGLFGVLLVGLRVHRPVLGRQQRALTSQIGILVGFNLLLGFGLGSFIDNAAHVGGLLAGAWLGLVLRPRGAPTLGSLWQRPPASGTAAAAGPRGSSEVLVTGAAVVLLIGVLAVGVMLGTDQRRDRRAETAGSRVGVSHEPQ